LCNQGSAPALLKISLPFNIGILTENGTRLKGGGKIRTWEPTSNIARAYSVGGMMGVPPPLETKLINKIINEITKYYLAYLKSNAAIIVLYSLPWRIYRVSYKL
jgi:hypothetical protein